MPSKKQAAADSERRVTERRTPAKTPKPIKPESSARADLAPDELRQLISEAAYYRAKQRGFEPGHEIEDWVQAEAEVIRRLNGPGTRA
jgi:Protein of unknown function (DUF2934)